MDVSLGRITAHLADPVENRLKELVQAINNNIAPPAAVTEEDVYIRAMYIASDEVNSFGGRFPSDELEHLARLIIDSPVMVGHRKDKLPIGRNFHAAVVDRDGKRWVKSYFYWLKSAAGAENLKENIDGGIYKECSIGFMFNLPECSVCGKDIRTCRHQPFEKYSVGGNEVVCHFNYRRLERVLETSLVYRGAVPDTSVSKELRAPSAETNIRAVKEIADLGAFEAGQEYLVTPHYEGIEVMVNVRNGRLTITEAAGAGIGDDLAARFDLHGLHKLEMACGLLIGYRGKERCPVGQLRKYLDKGNGPVCRVQLCLFPSGSLTDLAARSTRSTNDVRVIRHEITSGDMLSECAQRLSTKSGVLIYTDPDNPLDSPVYHYQPEGKADESNSWLLHSAADGSDACISFNSGNQQESFRIAQFNLARLLKGGRFLADRQQPVTSARGARGERRIQGKLDEAHSAKGGFRLRLSGGLSGTFILQPVTIKGLKRYLLYQLTASE